MFNPIELNEKNYYVLDEEIVLATYDYLTDRFKAYRLKEQDAIHIVTCYDVQWFHYLSMSSDYKVNYSGGWDEKYLDLMCKAIDPAMRNFIDSRNKGNPGEVSLLIKVDQHQVDVLARLTIPTTTKTEATNWDLQLVKHFSKRPHSFRKEAHQPLTVDHLIKKRGFNLAVFKNRAGSTLAILFESGTDISERIDGQITSNWVEEEDLFATYLRHTGTWPCASGDNVEQALARLNARLARIPLSMCSDYEDVLIHIREELNERHKNIYEVIKDDSYRDVTPGLQHILDTFGLQAYQ